MPHLFSEVRVEHVTGEVEMKRNLKKLLEAPVIVELEIGKHLIKKYGILARVSSRVHLFPYSSKCGPVGDDRGHEGLDLSVNISLTKNLDDLDGPPCIYVVAKTSDVTNKHQFGISYCYPGKTLDKCVKKLLV